MGDEKAKPKAKTKAADECGDIGDIGEHGYVGDLGTNHPEGLPRPHVAPEVEEGKADA